jgi:tetratricopeptide (TPR) repeat protein
MTDEPQDHEFSSGQGFEEPYEGFDLDPEIATDADVVDPVDAHVLPDQLDEAAIDAGDVDAEELLEVGISYVGINRHEQAADALERAARFADDDGLAREAWINKGVAHAELEEYDQAIGAYEEALRVDDEGEDAAVAETNLAYALWEFGRTGEALEHAERAVELDPRFAEAWYNRGLLLNERGLSEDALNSFENAIRLGHRTPALLEEQAIALEAVGEDERAQEVAEEAEAMRESQQEELLE